MREFSLRVRAAPLMSARPFNAIASLLLAVCLVQFGSAVQWHELEHLGERLAQVDLPNSGQDESDDGIHSLCKVCLSLKSQVLADSSVRFDGDINARSFLRLTETTGTSFIPDWPPMARGPPGTIL